MPPEEREAYINSLPEEIREKVRQRVAEYRPAPDLLPSLPLPDKLEPQNPERQNPVERPQPPSPDQLEPNLPEEKEKKEYDPSRFLNRLETLAGVTGTMMDMANMQDPSASDEGVGAAAGALKGIAAGAALGPLGMIGGAFIGGISSAIQAGNQREAFEEQERLRRQTLLSGLRINPSMREKGGAVQADQVEKVPVQAEKGEVILTPDGKLVNVMATDTHKQQKAKLKKKKGSAKNAAMITDVMENESFVFSNSKKRLIDLSKIADDILTVTQGRYSEDGNTPGKTITMGDIFGRKGKITPADAAKKIRRMFPIVEEPVEDVEKRTNAENLRRRAELLKPIMLMQEGVYRPVEIGKPVYMEQGGFPSLSLFPAPLSSQDPPKTRQVDEDWLLEAVLGGRPLLQSSGTPPPRETIPGLDVNRIMDLLKQLSPADRGQFLSELPEATRQKVQQALAKIASTEYSMFAAEDSATPTTPAAPATPASPTTPAESTAPATPATPEKEDSIFDRYGPILDERSKRIDADYAESLAGANKLFRNNRFRNLGILAADMAKIGAQNPNVTPVREGQEFVSQMFPEISESQVRAQIAPLAKRSARALEAINNSGIAGSKVGSAIAPILANELEAEARIRSQAVTTNQNQRAKRYATLNKIINTNRANEINALNETTSNRNQLANQLGDEFGQYVAAAGSIEQAIQERMDELKKWRQENKDKITEQQLDIEMRKEKRAMEVEWRKRQEDTIRKAVESIVDKYLETK